MYWALKESMSRGLKPDSLPHLNVRTEVQTYLRSNSKDRNKRGVVRG
jgi:hypothetical protein